MVTGKLQQTLSWIWGSRLSPWWQSRAGPSIQGLTYHPNPEQGNWGGHWGSPISSENRDGPRLGQDLGPWVGLKVGPCLGGAGLGRASSQPCCGLAGHGANSPRPWAGCRETLVEAGQGW